MDDTGEYPTITSDKAMPVCLVDGRLLFLSDCIVHATPMDGLQLVQVEEAGDSWDGASIPRMFWCFIGRPLSQEFRWASFWHDRLCEQSTTWAERRTADAILLLLLDQCGVGYFRRTAMWLAVRAYAWLWWSWRDWR